MFCLKEVLNVFVRALVAYFKLDVGNYANIETCNFRFKAERQKRCI
jgi:hypothetical protein